MLKNLWVLFSVLVLSATVAQANDDDLYDPAPPADSAFVRIIHAAQAKTTTITAGVGGVAYGEMSYPTLTNYRIVKGGTHKAQIGEASAEVNIEAGGYFTVALMADGSIKLIKDELLANPAKARVYFYNFSDAPMASLFASEHGAAILDKVTANDGNSREVNALKLNLDVKAGDTVAKSFSAVQLKRRVGTSFLLTGKAGAYQALMLENEVER